MSKDYFEEMNIDYEELNNYVDIETYYNEIENYTNLVKNLQCDRVESQKYIVRVNKQLNKYKEVLDKIKKYAEENKIIGVIAREENEYMVHILELLEEIE